MVYNSVGLQYWSIHLHFSWYAIRGLWWFHLKIHRRIRLERLVLQRPIDVDDGRPSQHDTEENKTAVGQQGDVVCSLATRHDGRLCVSKLAHAILRYNSVVPNDAKLSFRGFFVALRV